MTLACVPWKCCAAWTSIASEDTRKTGLLLKHFDIKKPQMSFEEHNEERAGERIMALLAEGRSVALVTEAGTPGISDPGFTLVRRAIAAGEEVTLVPGPTALIMALVLSGLPVHSFTYRGFPPRKTGPRRRFLEVDAASPHTLIFYESPYRVEDLLRDALAVYGDREAALAHELTKFHESVRRGKLSDSAAVGARVKAQGRIRGRHRRCTGGHGEPAEAVIGADAGRQEQDAE